MGLSMSSDTNHQQCPPASRHPIAKKSQPDLGHLDESLTQEAGEHSNKHAREWLSPIQRLSALRENPRSSDHCLSPPQPSAPSETMAEARSLFEEYGIDRPAG